MAMSLTIPGAAQFENARVAVVGMGISGRSSVSALLEHTNARVSVWDAQENAVKPYETIAGIDTAAALASGTDMANAVLEWNPTHVILAPAFREQGDEWKILHAAGIPVWSEIELAWQLRAQREDGIYAPWLAVTGTNGKTTTTSMLAAILKEAGLGGEPLGNIGNPAVTAVSDVSSNAPRAFALELSSFQLMSTFSMQPAAAVCLNLADDHLEWHTSFSSYRDAKARIYNAVQTACVYPVGDSSIQAMVDEADVCEGARAIGTVLGVPSVGQIGVVDGIVVDRAFGNQRFTHAEELFYIDDLTHLAPVGSDLPAHIVKDALAAAALARAIGIAPEHIRAALTNFPAGKHRIEYVATIGGVSFVDDSKATNAHAALASLRAQREGSVVWIAGGQAKGSHFEELVERVTPQLKAVVVIGVDQEPWHEALSNCDLYVEYIDPASQDPMNAAVRRSHALAMGEGTVLLAPACASMDQFVSYADRGEKFASAVQLLSQEYH